MKKDITLIVWAGDRRPEPVQDQVNTWLDAAKEPLDIQVIVAVPKAKLSLFQSKKDRWEEKTEFVGGNFDKPSEAFNEAWKAADGKLLICITGENQPPAAAWDQAFTPVNKVIYHVVKVSDGLDWTVQTPIVGSKYAKAKGRVLPQGFPGDAFAHEALTHEADATGRLQFVDVAMPKTSIPATPEELAKGVVHYRTFLHALKAAGHDILTLSEKAETQGHVEFLKKIGIKK